MTPAVIDSKKYSWNSPNVQRYSCVITQVYVQAAIESNQVGCELSLVLR